jgi:hypothetical protein
LIIKVIIEYGRLLVVAVLPLTHKEYGILTSVAFITTTAILLLGLR